MNWKWNKEKWNKLNKQKPIAAVWRHYLKKHCQIIKALGVGISPASATTFLEKVLPAFAYPQVYNITQYMMVFWYENQGGGTPSPFCFSMQSQRIALRNNSAWCC